MQMYEKVGGDVSSPPVPSSRKEEQQMYKQTHSAVDGKEKSADYKTNSVFEIVVEEMKHISRFQMLIRRKSKDGSNYFDNESTAVSVSTLSNSKSRLRINGRQQDEVPFSVTFPRILNETRLQIQDGNTLQLSLSYEDDPTLRELGSRRNLADVGVINSIRCGTCQSLLFPQTPIRRTVELPVGHWDEIVDYLICYNGQPSVDFSTASMSVDRSVALQDANVICFNYADMIDTACVKPVTGYGEDAAQDEAAHENKFDLMGDPAATVRGERQWRDLSGGASVCCSKCDAPIGFASIESPESFRLLKHRLLVTNPKVNLPQKFSSCASFLARELVRYAESKAIFTFIVTLDAPKMSFASTVFTKCILLRLVSWDCNIATSFEEDTEELSFTRMAKVIFEETLDKKAKSAGNWVWGGIDLCCPPPDNVTYSLDTDGEDDDGEDRPSAISPSAARIKLHEVEYLELLDSLRKGQSFFSEEVTEATILVKMANELFKTNSGGGYGSNLGLSAISIMS